MSAMASDFDYDAAPLANDDGFDAATIEEMPALEALKRGSTDRIDKLSAIMDANKACSNSS